VVGYIASRVVQFLLVAIAVVTVVFFALRSVPGSPAQALLGPNAAPAQVRQLEVRLGLDRPFIVQYGLYIASVARGDLGMSIRYRRPVVDLVARRIGPTFQLSLAATLLAILVAVPAGIVASLRPNSALDNAILSLVLVGQAMPTFWWGIVLVIVFSLQLQLLPALGHGTWQHLVLPAVTLSTFMMALFTRLVRSSVLEVMSKDYIRTATAKGLPGRIVLFKHALRNSIIPVLTVLGVQVGVLLGGAVITETVFDYPGIGLLLIEAINSRDYPVVQVVVIVIAIMLAVVNLVVDVLYILIDPRIRLT